MKKYSWAKTLLSVYRYLERMADNIDKLIDRCAENSFYVTGSNFCLNSTSVVADNIIELSERKVRLINIKVLSEDALEKCDSICAQVLIAKYFDGQKSNEIAGNLGLSMRTYFRKLEEGIKSFALNLNRLGFNDEKLSKYLKNEDWIMIVHDQLEEEDAEVELSDKLLRKFASTKPMQVSYESQHLG